jgi:hypothetical protein
MAMGGPAVELRPDLVEEGRIHRVLSHHRLTCAWWAGYSARSPRTALIAALGW